jgi:hypothetical protein
MTATSPPREREVINVSACRAYLTAAGLVPPDVRAAFLTGSHTRGWSNPGSDCDVYVIAEGLSRAVDSASIPVPLDPGFVPVHVGYADDRRWEIKYWTDGQVGQVLDKVSAARFEAGQAAYSLNGVEELLLERLLTCLPIIGAQWVTARRDDVRHSAYREFLVTRSLGYADHAAAGALGQLAGLDLHSAVLSAHLAMRHTVDALLESVECYGTATAKWRARRMRDAAPAALSFERYWSMETMRDLDPADPGNWVRQTISWCRETAMEIEI